MDEERRDNLHSPVSRPEGSLLLTLHDSIANLKSEVVRLVSSHADEIQHISDLLRLLRPTLIHDDDGAKDAFRDLGGFEVLTDLLRSLQGAFSNDDVRHEAVLHDLICAVFELIAEALTNNVVNCRNFGKSSTSPGWSDFTDAFVDTLIFARLEGQERAFGLLFSLALQEENLKGMFRRVRLTSKKASTENDDRPTSVQDKHSSLVSSIQQIMDSSEFLCVPQIVPTILRCWKALQNQLDIDGAIARLAMAVILTLDHICRARMHNLVVMHRTGAPKIVLDYLSSSAPDSATNLALLRLSHTLMKAGLDTVSQAANIISSAQKRKDMRYLLEQHTSMDSQSSLHFDMSVSGYAAIEFADLGKTFMGTTPSQKGYSLSMWFEVDAFDETCHTTIFGAFDTSQSCFILVYIDQKSRQLVFQTSASSTRPSAKFKAMTFEPRLQYHIIISHHRASQLASLYCDGKLLEHVDCSYPRLPNDKSQPIQAFVGTPFDLAARLGRNVSLLKWSLSSLYLFNKVITPEVALVYYMLGPNYEGNFQDGLGSFFTYDTSSRLTLFEERRHQRGSASESVAEIVRSKELDSNILLGVTTSMFMSVNTSRLELLLKTSKTSRMRKQLLQYNTNGFIVNSSILNLRRTLAQPRCLGRLTEGMTVSKSKGMLDFYWSLAGGVPLLLRTVAVAPNMEDMLRSLRTVFQSLKRSWRLSEAFERDDAFAILAWIIKTKLGVSSINAENAYSSAARIQDVSDHGMSSLLRLILQFIGVDTERPERSMLTNPLAYRIMIQDFIVWNRPFTRCQQTYYQHFTILLEVSRLRRFNIRRLSKMRTLRNLFESFRQAEIHRDAAPVIKDAIITLLRHTSSSDTLRSAALYIASSLQSPSSTEGASQLSSYDVSLNHDGSNIVMSKYELSLIVLEAYTDFLCLESVENIHKFIKTVTNKWLLHLLDTTDAQVLCYTLRLLARLLHAGGAQYASNFEEKTFGFDIVRSSLCAWTSMPFVWASTLGILLGVDAAELELARSSNKLETTYRTWLEKRSAVVCPGVWKVISGLLKTSVSQATNDKVVAELLGATLAFLQTFLVQSRDFMRFAQSSESFLRDIFALLFVEEINRSLGADPLSNSHLRNAQTQARDAEGYDCTTTAPLETMHSDFLQRPHCMQAIQLMTETYTDQILSKADFKGLGLFMKAPEVQFSVRSQCSSAVIQSLLNSLVSELSTHPRLYLEPRSLSNVAHFVSQVADGVLEGWLEGVSFGILHYAATLLLYIQTPDIRDLKIIRLCSPTIESMIDVFRKLAIVQLSRLHEFEDIKSRNNFVTWMSRWKYLLLSRGSNDELPLEPLFYVLCKEIVMIDDISAQESLAQIWSACIRCEPENSMKVLSRNSEDAYVLELFAKLTGRGTDMLPFLRSTIQNLQDSVIKNLQHSCESFMRKHNSTVRTSLQSRCKKREERLHQRHLAELAVQHALTEHESRSVPWQENIYFSELAKHKRSRQDQQDLDAFLQARYHKIVALINRLHIFNEPPQGFVWALDASEGRERQKLRIRPVESRKIDEYVPKRARSKSAATTIVPVSITPEKARTINATCSPPPVDVSATGSDSANEVPSAKHNNESAGIDGFEVVHDHGLPDEEVVDINRKIMRSLQRGERILEVHNVSRIRGLEAISCLLIVGSKCLYLLDNLFQKADGEVVNAEQAPKDETDNYLIDTLGKTADKSGAGLVQPSSRDVRQWLWASIINISERRFLLRDVAVELFFQDGRSYLLTTADVLSRKKLYDSLAARASSMHETPTEFKWRTQQFLTPETGNRSVSSKFFGSGPEHPITARWLRGEFSNFQYLMLINTMAGRTFTDITQYPVFPWVLQDYTSNELDLDNTGVYRDLSKPMGAQHADRELAYRERYRAFAEMGDPDTPAFHYGTHYSSAMIVTSYLIRLEPFVRSYVLLQGGAFDYPDRLFDDIGKTWLSASRDTVTDVRELTPEFYYLPDFLRNINEYNFGTKEGSGEVVNDVKLPPWAKGDPKIFIARSREALESPYVTANLHSWIDLVFGYKQQGEAAIEATNVFHHLSYYGAKNVEEIEDERERLAAIGIIHNFGNTPRQIFFKPHQPRQIETIKSAYNILATLCVNPEPCLQVQDQITQLDLTPKSQRLVYAGPYQSYHPPSFHTYMEWGNTDGSLRFYKADSGKLLDLFEALHTDHITVAAFVDSRTLVTASLDCTVSVWSVEGPASGPSDLQLKSGLFGHREAVNILVVCSTLSTILTASVDGKVILWDLNSFERLRELDNSEQVDCAQINHRTGHFVLCSGKTIKLFTINGELILEQNICAKVNDSIKSCAFYITSGDEWTDGEYILTGHTQGVAKIWRSSISRLGKWLLELVKELNYAEIPNPGSGRSGFFGSRAAQEPVRSTNERLADITCVYAMDKRVFTGDENGCVYEWTSR